MLAKPLINFQNVGIPTALRGTLSICLMTKSRCLYYTDMTMHTRLGYGQPLVAETYKNSKIALFQYELIFTLNCLSYEQFTY